MAKYLNAANIIIATAVIFTLTLMITKNKKTWEI